MCCRVTRSDVTHVYFQHLHVNVDAETPHTHTRTCEEINAASCRDGAEKSYTRACFSSASKLASKLTFGFLHNGRRTRESTSLPSSSLGQTRTGTRMCS